MSYGQVNADVIGTSVAGANLGAGNASLMKNRIINGAMVIDQRNAGAAITPSADSALVDRFYYEASNASKFTFQQNAGSVTPPVGFTKYLGATVASTQSIASGSYFMIEQRIEGNNIADLGWGTANAKTVTLSFWVQSSLTGTFGGSVQNSAFNRSYPFTYTISAANTWEYKSVTIAGDTSGTWVTTNALGMVIEFGLGVGSTYSTTAGAWAAGNYNSATGATSVVSTAGATFYITGVQLEVGSSATGFEYRQYGQELALCQRYFQTFKYKGLGAASSAQAATFPIALVTEMRSTPSASRTSGSITVSDLAVSGYVTTTSTVSVSSASGTTAINLEINSGWSPSLNTLRPLAFSTTGTPSSDAALLLSSEL